MAGRFVRASKYRHVYGQPTKKEQCYDNLRISKNAWDTNLIKANPEYIAVNWEASGGGAFAVIPVNERGKLPDRLPLFRGHTGAVLDTDWNPFDDHLLASASDDGKVFLWRVPDGFTLHTDAEDPVDISPVGRLTGHSRKVGHVLFNTAAQNVLASSSGDFNVKIWDIEQGKDRLVLKHNEIVQSMSWNDNGSLLATTSRDKKLRIWDTRTEKPAFEVPGHAGAKNSRAVWLGSHDRIATTGFSKMSDRQLGLWDARNPGEPIGGFQILDSISGVCMPFWDDGNQILYLAGKGDGNIRYFEYANDKFEYLTEYKSAEPQRGIAFVPKRGVNVHENEIARAYKTVADSYIEPISFIVPRRAEVFQDDIYPPTVGLKAGTSGSDWFGGKAATPPLVSLRGKYEGGEAEQLPADQQPQQKASSPIKAAAPASKPEPKPAPAAAPQPTPAPREVRTKLEDNKQAMSDMANRFADQNEDDDDDASSFEEVAKPIERPARQTPLASPPPSATPITSSFTRSAAPTSTSNTAASRQPPSTKAAEPSPTSASASASAPAPSSTSASTPTASSTTPSTGAGLAAGLGSHLSDIKQSQHAALGEISELKDQVRELQELVKGLAAQLGQVAGGQSERIRRVELEMESLRE